MRSILKLLVVAAALLGLSAPAMAETVVGGLTAVGKTASLTRPANTTAYAANQLVCAASCAPLQVTLTLTPGATGTNARLLLLKSGSSLTNASFNIWLFKAAPTLPAGDQASYVGPYAADISSGAYLGEFSCTSMANTNDASAQAYSECTPVGQTWIPYQTLSGQTYVDALISTGGAYTPVSGETFTLVVSAFKDQ